MTIDIPDSLAYSVATSGKPSWREWLDRLPSTVEEYVARWQLAVEAPFQPGGMTAWVAPATTPDGTDCVLKVAFRHPESDGEAAGLRAWAGEGAVQLLDAHGDDDTAALLLERLHPGDDLHRLVDEPDQDPVVAGLLRRLWRATYDAGELRPLAQMCQLWADAYRTAPAAHVDAGLADEGLRTWAELAVASPGDVLLATDLHAGNVLAAEREPWLVIDPKPYVGDPAYDVLQHLLNCPDRLMADPLALVARMAGLCEVDAERVRRWLFARCVVESMWWPFGADLARRLAP